MGASWMVLVFLLPLLLAGTAEAKTTVAVCEALMGFLSLDFPLQGTLLCPSDKAFKSFARASGYKTWDLMWEEITNNAERWTPYMTRIITYMHLDDVVMGAQITRKEIEVTTSLVTEVDADGNPTAYAKVLLDKVLSPWGIRKRAVISGKKRAYFVKADLIKEDGAVVHAVNKVFMPPDTYPSIKEAFSRNPELWTSGRMMKRQLRSLISKADSWVTVLAPTNKAWRTLKPTRGVVESWQGGVTLSAVRRDKVLQAAMANYFVVDMVDGVNDQPVTYEAMQGIWDIATEASTNFVSFPSRLTANAEQQLSMYTYDSSTDAIYLVGGRNEQVTPYMAAGMFKKRTIYAGLATLLTVEGTVPIPVRTGISQYDTAPIGG